MPTLRSFGLSSTIQVGRISPSQVLALQVLPVCTYNAPACAYLAFVCVFTSLLVLADTARLRQRVVLACFLCSNALHLFAHAFALPARVLSLHLVFSSIATTTIVSSQSWVRGVDTDD